MYLHLSWITCTFQCRVLLELTSSSFPVSFSYQLPTFLHPSNLFRFSLPPLLLFLLKYSYFLFSIFFTSYICLTSCRLLYHLSFCRLVVSTELIFSLLGNKQILHFMLLYNLPSFAMLSFLFFEFFFLLGLPHY